MHAGQAVCTKIADRTAAWRRERRVLLRVSRAAWRLEQAGRERSWALASARAEGVSIRALAAAAGLSSSRVHQVVAAADLDELDAQLGELRAAGWPAPEDPDGDDDAELDGRDTIADRLVDEAGWLRQCSGWLTRLHADDYPPAVNLRPGGDHPGRALVVVDLPRVAAILDRIAADIDELARARRADDLAAAAVLPASAPNAAGAWPSRTWISGSSAAVRRSRHPRNDPGTPTRPSGTAAGISGGAGNNRAVSTATASSFLNGSGVSLTPLAHVSRRGCRVGV
jgi:hypothetical protein